MRNIKIIFMGTPEFAVPSLARLIEEKFEIVAVITAPDKPKGRGQKLSSSPIKALALAHNLPVLQPTNLKDPVFLQTLKSYQADLQVVVAFRMLPEAVWSMPSLGTFNLHASLLPQYRGAAPINWAVINGEKETGITTFLLKHVIDTGDIIFQEKEPIYPKDTAGTLYERLMHKGADLVVKTAKAISTGNFSLQQQVLVDEEIKPAPKIFKEDCQINWDQPSEKVVNFVRGLSPYPTSWTMLQEKLLKIYEVSPTLKVANFLKPGEFKSDNKTYLHFKTSDGMVAVEDLQLEGKKRMKIEAFLRGNTLTNS